MSGYSSRRLSPPPSRRYGDPRASTGMVYSSSFDPRHAQYPRSSIDTLSTRSGGGSSGGGSYGAQPISRKTYVDPSYGNATSKTEYAVRPRHNSVESGPRRPLSLMVPTNAQDSSRQRPVITSAGGHDRSRSPLPSKPYYPKEYPKEDRYVYPAVSSPRHHARHSSATVDDYTRRPERERDRDRRERTNSYISSSTGRGHPKAYHALHAPVVRQSEPDDYSYTGPREQFDRDYPQPQPRPRRNSLTRAERPVSAADFGDWVPPNQSRREPGPPVSSARHFERLGRSESHRQSTRPGAGSDTERDPSLTRPRRNSRTRAPVSLHQERDEGYSSQRDDYGDRREHRPRRDKYEDDRYTSDRERPHHKGHHERRNSVTRNGRTESRDRPSLSTGLAAAGLGATAAAGLVGLARERSKDEEPSKEARREERDRDRERRRREVEREAEEREREYRPEKPRDRPVDSGDDPTLRDPRRERVQRDRSDSDSQEGHEAKERRRRHRHEKERSHHDGDSETGSEARQKDSARHEQGERESELDDSGHRRHKHHHRHHRHDSHVAPEEPSVQENPPAPVEEEYRPKKVTVVEPPKEKELEIKPKGILKQPKPAFPEDPNPTREGVAPLKDAGKKGIPPGARWTKINRLLVNPAALEDAHERFEERDEYVIVLRVLSKEEIQKFADKTKEIREIREREYREKQRAAKAQEREPESDDLDESDDYTSDEEDATSQDRRLPAPYQHQLPSQQHQQESLAIEPPPPATQHQGAFGGAQGYQQNYVPGVDLGNGVPQQGQQQPYIEHAQLPTQQISGLQQQQQQYPPPPPPPVPPQSTNGV